VPVGEPGVTGVVLLLAPTESARSQTRIHSQVRKQRVRHRWFRLLHWPTGRNGLYTSGKSLNEAQWRALGEDPADLYSRPGAPARILPSPSILLPLLTSSNRSRSLPPTSRPHRRHLWLVMHPGLSYSVPHSPPRNANNKPTRTLGLTHCHPPPTVTHHWHRVTTTAARKPPKRPV